MEGLLQVQKQVMGWDCRRRSWCAPGCKAACSAPIDVHLHCQMSTCIACVYTATRRGNPSKAFIRQSVSPSAAVAALLDSVPGSSTQVSLAMLALCILLFCAELLQLYGILSGWHGTAVVDAVMVCSATRVAQYSGMVCLDCVTFCCCWLA
jgi:hypothetical protein